MKLGALLRQLRTAAGLSGPVLAGQLVVSQSHLSRVEHGEAVATPELVAGWAQITNAPAEARQRAAELAESVAIEVTTWKAAVARGLVKLQREAALAEGAAKTIRAWVPVLIPGLMQTAAYARALVARDYPDRSDVDAAVAARMQRQIVLQERTKTLRWVIGEAGLRSRVAPVDVMAAQLGRVADLLSESYLDIRVLPFDRTGTVWHDHGFTILGDREDGEPDLVHLELLTGAVNIVGRDEVARYQVAYDRLADLALQGAHAAAFIRKVRAELNRDR